MKSLAKELISKLFFLLGFEITRKSGNITRANLKFAPEEKDRYKWIQNMGIKTVIDVGAHNGESASHFHELFPDARIYSFEPLHDCFTQLKDAMKNVTNFKAFNIALGDKEERINIHRSDFTPSSSLLKMAKLHREAFPFSSGESLETTNVNTLDNVAEELDLEDSILLKIDVQGYEHNVIMGSVNILKRVKIIIIETSFHELYEGQPLFSDIYELLYEQGFVYAGSWGELKSPHDGIPLQQDSIFVRR